MEDLYLTKEEAISYHRKMWNWIADRLEDHNGTKKDIFQYKEKYIEKNFPDKFVYNHCFCCQYAKQQVDDDIRNFCIYCPLLWGTESETDGFFCEQGNYDIPIEDLSLFDYGLWIYADKLAKNGYHSEAAEIARQIANLPER